MKPSGTVFDKSLAAQCRVMLCGKRAIHGLVMRHYLHGWPAVNVARYALLWRTRVVGACVYSLPPRETEIRYGGPTWELSRLFVEDEMPANTETWFISATIRDIRKRCPDVYALVSYADPSAGHEGVIYRAANWQADGKTGDGRLTMHKDYIVDGTKFSRRSHVPEGAIVETVDRVRKFRYFYLLREHRERTPCAR